MSDESLKPVRSWCEWSQQVLEPAMRDTFDGTDEVDRMVSRALKDLAAAAFAAGHRYGFARATDPDLE